MSNLSKKLLDELLESCTIIDNSQNQNEVNKNMIITSSDTEEINSKLRKFCEQQNDKNINAWLKASSIYAG